MSRRSFLLVFPSDALWLTGNAKPLEAALDIGDEIFALDGNVVFIRADQTLEKLLDRLQSAHFSGRQFFLTDITDATRAGNMPSVFWNAFSLKQNEDVAA